MTTATLDLPQDATYRIKSLRSGTDQYLEVRRDGSVGVGWPSSFGDRQHWNFIQDAQGLFRISSARDCSLFISVVGRRPECSTVPTSWKIDDFKENGYSINHPGDIELAFSLDDTGSVVFQSPSEDHDKLSQRWSIERVTDREIIDVPPPTFSGQYFKLTKEAAVAGGPYDFIIIGTGIGGGVLAGDLFDRYRKLGRTHKILVVEKGHLLFHSHCLNTSRPSEPVPDRGQDNDAFFRDFRTPYNMNPPKGDWNGGALYALGGRSSVWGLFAPRPHDETLQQYFPKSVRKDLIDTYFEQAETLMKLSMPKTKPIHYHLMNRLDLACDPDAHVQWQWGRITSEFHDEKNFSFSQGAYSPIDKLLEIAMAVPPKREGLNPKGSFEILLNAEVERLGYVESSMGQTVERVYLKDFSDPLVCKPGGQVVLCAGSVESTAILLRSGVDIAKKGGTHITDHDIYFVERRFYHENPLDRDAVGSMKLQTYMRLGTGHKDIALVNMSVDASSFLSRRNQKDNSTPKFIFVFMLKSKLNKENKIELYRQAKEFAMKQMADVAIETVAKVLKVRFIDPTPGSGEGTLKLLGLGAVAHELGSIPMPEKDNHVACLDANLSLTGFTNVSVCDLSVFPVSVEVNPTLTLAALALRLSDRLLPFNVLQTLLGISAMNQTEEKISVRASDGSGKDEGYRDLSPGEVTSWNRRLQEVEGIFVRGDDPARSKVYKATVGDVVCIE